MQFCQSPESSYESQPLVVVLVRLASSLCLRMMAKHMVAKNAQQTHENQSQIVRVAGRYRVGELLGSSGSGKLNSDFSSRQSSERSSECLFREKYQDRS